MKTKSQLFFARIMVVDQFLNEVTKNKGIACVFEVTFLVTKLSGALLGFPLCQLRVVELSKRAPKKYRIADMAVEGNTQNKAKRRPSAAPRV
jgi:hypothetical protein